MVNPGHVHALHTTDLHFSSLVTISASLGFLPTAPTSHYRSHCHLQTFSSMKTLFCQSIHFYGNKKCLKATGTSNLPVTPTVKASSYSLISISSTGANIMSLRGNPLNSICCTWILMAPRRESFYAQM